MNACGASDSAILSDVHSNSNRRSTFCTVSRLENSDLYLTEFKIKCPDYMNEKIRDFTSPDTTICENLVLDEDGDIVVTRRNNLKINAETQFFTLRIHHSLATSLDNVSFQVWTGALLMIDYVLHKHSSFSDMTVLELGGGVGLTSLVVGMIAKTVILTDVGATAMQLCDINYQENESLLCTKKESYRISELDWFQTESIKSLALPKPDIIIACDVIYDNNITDAFFHTLHKLLTENFYAGDNTECPRDITVYISTEKRLNFTLADLDVTCKEYDHFRDCLAHLENTLSPSLTVEQIDVKTIPQYCEYNRTQQLEIWKLHKV